MTYVVGDATHFQGKPLSGSPEPGDVWVYDGSGFVPLPGRSYGHILAGDFLLIAAGSDDTVRFSGVSGIVVSGVSDAESGKVVRIGISGVSPDQLPNFMAIPGVDALVQNIQRDRLEIAMLGNQAGANMAGGMYDTFQDVSRIESLSGHFDSNAKLVEPLDQGTSLETRAAFASPSGVSHNDLKATIARWVQDSGATGHFEAEAKILAGPAVDYDTQVVLPCSGHGLGSGDIIEIRETTAYNGDYTLPDQVAHGDADHIAVTTSEIPGGDFVSETLSGSANVRQRISLGSGNDNPNIEKGLLVCFSGSERTIVGITGDGEANQEVELSSSQATADIVTIQGTRHDDEQAKVSVNYATDPDGSANQSTTDRLPVMTSNNTGAATASASSTNVSGIEYQAFDNLTTGVSRWVSALNQVTNQWLEINLGSGNGFAANKWRWLGHPTDNSFNPKRFKLQGYNGTSWVDLDTAYASTDYTQIAAGTWSAWFPFSNATKYERYRIYVMSGYSASYLAIQEIEIVECRMTAAQAAQAVHTTSEVRIDTSSWHALTGIQVTQDTPANSTIYHALSFNMGDADEKWKVYVSAAWKDIARLQSGTWQYRDGSDDWQDAASNNRLTALRQAFSVTANQMTKSGLEALSAEYSSAFEAGTLDFAAGLKADAGNVPALTGYTVIYDPGNHDLLMVSAPRTADIVPGLAMCTLLVKNYHPSVQAYVSCKDNPQSGDWSQLTGFTEIADLADNVKQYSTGEVPISGHTDKKIRLKLEAGYGHDAEIHGYALNWG